MNTNPSHREVFEQYMEMTDVLEMLNEYYKFTLLHDSILALSYLTDDRGISIEMIDKFALGYAPPPDRVEKFASLNAISIDVIRSAGAVSEKLMDRITFPLFDLEGRIMGFSARVWPPTDTTRPKYYNSAASPTFWKSLTLYGLYQALDSIKKDNFALVVEGNLDVIQLHANDLTHAVAPCGTALTKEQLLMLVRLTDRIIFCFDADTAGINATAKVKKLCEESNVTFMSFSLDGAKDPDEFIRLYGAQPIIDTIKGLLRDYNKGREKSGR